MSLGLIATWLGFISALLCIIITLSKKEKVVSKCLNPLVLSIFFFSAVAFINLVYLYIISDFSFANVYLNSHQAKPLVYKITGSWGNHEGSILLFIFLFSLALMLFCSLSKVELQIKRIVILAESVIIAAFYAFLIFFSNPFERLLDVPLEGLGLNPLLQDIGLVIHPPLLYSGYIGFSLAFAFAIAVLHLKILDKNWAKHLKTIISISWALLTLGIGFGGWWAYRELGWGGFWFWDPVENAALMPWLFGTALLHSLIITQKTGQLRNWTLLLSLLTFIFCLIGFFLVRSGVVISVHSFASDPERGVFILAFVILVILYSLTLFAFNNKVVKEAKKTHSFFSKVNFVLLNNLLLVTSCFVVFLGTLYPLLLEVVTKQKISVGAPYFNSSLAPLLAIILLLMSPLPFLKWQKDNWRRIAGKLLLPVLISMIISLSLWLKADYNVVAYVILTIALIALFMVSNFFIGHKIKAQEYPMLISHSGFMIAMIALALFSILKQEKQLVMDVGDKANIAHYQLHLREVKHLQESNYLTRKASFDVYDRGVYAKVLKPEKRLYIVEQKQTSEVAIMRVKFLSDLYVVVGDLRKDGILTRIYYNPMVNLLWLGILLMVAGGFVSVIIKKR
jgi:cytochrome c-type biogenesis protein CcmF